MISISQPPPPIITRANIKTGTYTGNGVDNRDIDIGVDLASKANVYVIIKSIATDYGTHRVEYAQGDLGMVFFAEADAPNRIQSFTSTGFQIGIDVTVNSDLILYRYIAFWEEP